MALTVGGVKGKLGIPTTDTSKDIALTAVLHAAEDLFSSRTGYDLAAQTNLTDLFEQVQVGTVIALKRRPVASVASVQARHLSEAASWAAVGYDLVDAGRGRLVLLGGALQAGWPHFEPTAPYFVWRDRSWPLVKVTYSTSAFVITPGLEDAIHALAAYWYERHVAGAKFSSALSGVGQEAYHRWATPPWFDAVIARHVAQEAYVA